MEKIQSIAKPTNLEKEPFPDFVKGNDFFSVYPCDKMTIFVTKKPCPILKGEFSHLNYEFVVTMSPVVGMVLDGVRIDMKPDTLLAINSGQVHGTRSLISDVSFMNIQFDKTFLEELAYGVYGVKDLSFGNMPVLCGREMQELAGMYIEEYKQKRDGYSYSLSSLSIQIAIAIFRQLGIADQMKTVVSDANDCIRKAAEHLRQNFENDFSLDQLSGIANMSKFNFVRKFKDITGKTPREYFLDIRIMNALEYLNNPNFRIIDVALMCGFKNHSHFSQLFRQRTGLTPKEYRQNILGL